MVQLSLEDQAKAAIRQLEAMDTEALKNGNTVKQCVDQVQAAKLPEMVDQAWQIISSKLRPADGMILESLDANLRYMFLEGQISRTDALLLQSTRMMNRVMYGGVSVPVKMHGIKAANVATPDAPKEQ